MCLESSVDIAQAAGDDGLLRFRIITRYTEEQRHTDISLTQNSLLPNIVAVRLLLAPPRLSMDAVLCTSCDCVNKPEYYFNVPVT